MEWGVKVEDNNKLTISDYHSVEKEMGELYTQIQKYSGLSDAEYWCLMTVRKGECNYQHEIYNQMFMSKQTVNSALKQLVKKGYIEMLIPNDNQRIRQIVFTKAGDIFAKKHLDVMQKIEDKAWSILPPNEQRTLVNALGKMNQILRQEIAHLKNE